jgi:hypothetical protein
VRQTSTGRTDLRGLLVTVCPATSLAEAFRRRRKPWRGQVLVTVLVLGLASTSEAVRLWSGGWGDRYYALDTSLKWTSLLSHSPPDTTLYPEPWSAASLWRMRLSLAARPAGWLSAEIAYEHRARAVSEGSGAAGGAGVLFAGAEGPYRISQLDESLVRIGDTFTYRHELDRALVAISLGRSQITLGRQAVGWGRGVLFSAVDVFAPFTPLESDREWRRGIDAVRTGVRLCSDLSVELVAAFGEDEESSALAGQLQGRHGGMDAGLLGGIRREDHFCAVTASGPVWESELHGELAVFKTPEALPDGGSFGQDDLVAKAVIGGSRSFDVGGELLLLGEYHYSGFGAADVESVGELLDDARFEERLLEGDTQLLGRHAVALQTSYRIGGGEASANILWITSPADGSGVVSPGVTWVFSDNVTLVAKGYVGYGKDPEDGEIRSEYGATPTTGLVQISFYY